VRVYGDGAVIALVEPHSAGDPFAKPARRRIGEPTVDSHEIFERIKQALVDGGFEGRRGHPRYQCPACGSPGDGHGLRITHHPNASGTKRKILLVCDANRCPPEEILEPLGLTLADICAGDDVDDLDAEGDHDLEQPGRITAVARPTSTVTARPREPFENGTAALQFTTLADLCARVDTAGPRQYLIRGIWPAGAYGVHAAEMKAQKTWNALDLAVSVASGTDWLGAYSIDDPGPVVIFAGEGGEASIVRRIRAICASRNLKAEYLPITVCTRAPHIADIAHMAAFAEHIGTIRPRLVLLDPLYLSLAGADGKDLYGMGRLLERPQILCDEAGASLLVVTHFNRGGRTGAGRITGAGPAEWGRVLIGAEVKSRHTDASTKATTVVAELDVIGGEVPDLTFRIKRTITADDPDDLDSPLRYTAEVLTDDSGDTRGDDMPPARRKLLDAVTALGRPATQTELVDWIAKKHGHGLHRTTASTEFNELRKADLVDCAEEAGRATMWFLPQGVVGVVATGTQQHPTTGDPGGVLSLSSRLRDDNTPTPQNDRSDVSAPIPGTDRCGDCSEPLDQHAGPGCPVPVIHRPADLWSTA
jgi:AAA domain